MNRSCTNEVMGTKIQLKMVEDIQCPGCAAGLNPETCSAFKLKTDTDGGEANCFSCGGWCPGTRQAYIGRIALGLPKGFCRIGMVDLHEDSNYIRLFEKTEDTRYDRFNIPVWAMEKDGYLYVRVISPRNNWFFVDVIKDGKIEMVSFKDGEFEHKAIDVGKFYDEID